MLKSKKFKSILCIGACIYAAIDAYLETKERQYTADKLEELEAEIDILRESKIESE